MTIVVAIVLVATCFMIGALMGIGAANEHNRRTRHRLDVERRDLEREWAALDDARRTRP